MSPHMHKGSGRSFADRDGFTAEDIEVMAERRFGWEGASCALLALVFNTTPQRVASLTAPFARNKLTALHGGDGAGLSASPQASATDSPRVASGHVLNGRPGDDVSSFHEVAIDDRA